MEGGDVPQAPNSMTAEVDLGTRAAQVYFQNGPSVLFLCSGTFL